MIIRYQCIDDIKLKTLVHTSPIYFRRDPGIFRRQRGHVLLVSLLLHELVDCTCNRRTVFPHNELFLHLQYHLLLFCLQRHLLLGVLRPVEEKRDFSCLRVSCFFFLEEEYGV